MAPTIDVVIVAYGHWDLTRSCLRHLQVQTIEHRVILVDNGCREGTADKVRSEFPSLEVIRLEHGVGFPAACNLGVRAGDGDVVAQINNDVDCTPDFLEKAVAPLERDSGIGIVSCVLLRPGGETLDSVGLTCDKTLAGFPRLRGRPVTEASNEVPVATGPAGAAAVIRRRVWEDIGGWDEAIFFYNEDLDFALRARIAGWRHAIATEAVATHVGSATAGHRSAWQRRHGGFGRGYALRRYGVLRTHAAPRVLLTEAIVVLGDAAASRDVEAAKGRIAGWRAAGDKPRLAFPPPEAVDHRITLRDAFRLRRGVYFGAPRRG